MHQNKFMYFGAINFTMLTAWEVKQKKGGLNMGILLLFLNIIFLVRAQPNFLFEKIWRVSNRDLFYEEVNANVKSLPKSSSSLALLRNELCVNKALDLDGHFLK